MNGRRVSVSIPGADARTLARAAQLADTTNLDIWLGDPRTQAANADDCYITTAAAAAAAVTSHCRIGLFLSLRGSGTPLRLAEDIGVVDQASGGRLELGLVAPTSAREEWEHDARALLRAWHDWPIDGGRSVAALPGPAQPWLPRMLVGGTFDEAERLGAGLLLFTSRDTSPPPIAGRERRIALGVEVAGSVRDWLAEDVLGAMLGLRAESDRAGAHDIVVVLADPDPDPAHLADDLRLLGVVVGTSVRCPAHKVEFLALDTWRWLHELTHLHEEIDVSESYV
ncbi:MAG: LLM class flavin-dependent oxidoreductase [Acidimicrobiales bacterium]